MCDCKYCPCGVYGQACVQCDCVACNCDKCDCDCDCLT